MIVLVLSAVPDGLRGHVTRWLLEISPGVFVGNLSARVREQLWGIVEEGIGAGRAIMVFRAANEQGLSFLIAGDPWEPRDFEGLRLMVRPNVVGEQVAPEQLLGDGERRGRPGISDFERRRRARRGFPRSDRQGR
ncbi:type I-E CRISPR-associated endoribonuclease Cas2e [Actinomyces sp. B33]|nr:type I-E CRISPR-associated endoribonuclease Cas2e [Actinomyces sp. B33]MDC4232359.1 type I-E CRISPR-associated endoribonuclease Cas2e [Actinomyces sp. B33]